MQQLQTEHSDTSYSARLVPVPSEHVDGIWDRVSHLADKACQEWHGCYTSRDIKQLAKDCDIQLWSAWKGKKCICLLGTQIYTHPQKKIAEIMFVGGEDMGAWVDFMESVADWARKEGCQSLIARARKGWERALKSYDFKTDRILVRRELYA